MKKNRKSASREHHKQSDRRELTADAKVLVALRTKQPQTRDVLCRNAQIDKSTFYRIRRLMMNRGILKETKNGYALSDYVEVESLWDRLRQKLLAVGGSMIDLKIEKLELSDERDPVTGWYKSIYDKLLPVQGIIILKGAKELEASASLNIPKEYLGFLLTQGNVEDGDRFSWRGNMYVIQEVEKVIDGYEVDYRIAKLVARYHQPLGHSR